MYTNIVKLCYLMNILRYGDLDTYTEMAVDGHLGDLLFAIITINI